MANISLKKAALINAASKYTSILFSIGFSMILARILTPEDYGIVAVTTVFTNFFSIFADMGISAGIVQYKRLTEEDTNQIFSFSMCLALLLGGLFAVSSFGIADFYSNDVYVPIGFLLAFSLFFSTINIVPNALLLKDKQFVVIAKRNIIIPFLTSLACVGMAYLGMKYWALVWQAVLSGAITFLWNFHSAWTQYHLRIHFGLGIAGIRKIFGYSAYQFLFGVINYFSRNLDNLLVGRYFGAVALGYYDKAYRLMSYPIGNLTHVITPVLQPILSDYQDDKRYIYDKYIAIVKFLSIVGVYIVCICYFMADEIIYIMFGSQWSAAVPYFKWLALSVWAQMILGTTGSIFQSAGDTKRLFITGCLTTCLTVSAIIAGVMTGELIDVARNVMLAYNLQFLLVMYILIYLTLRQPYVAFLRNFIPEIFMGIVLAVVGGYLGSILIDTAVVTKIFVKVLVFTFIFLALCKLLGQLRYVRLLHK